MTDIREQEMQNRIDALVLEKENLSNEISYLKEQVAYLKKLAFGSRTEKTKRVMGEDIEINLFDEAETKAKASAPEPVIEVPAHTGRTGLAYAADWLKHQLLLLQPIIHADETPVQVLGEKGRKNKTKSYMWVFTNGEYEQDGHQIRIYKYQPGRSGNFAGEFLKDYKGTLLTDGYAGYEHGPTHYAGPMLAGTLWKPCHLDWSRKRQMPLLAARPSRE